MSPQDNAALTEEMKLRTRAKMQQVLAGDVGRMYGPTLATLDKYKVYHEGSQRPFLARVHDIAWRLDKMTARGCGIVLAGTVGTGKDHVAIALMYRAIKDFGIGCRWFMAADLFQRSRDIMKGDEREKTFIDEMTRPTIITISDPLPPEPEVNGRRANLSSWQCQLLYKILDKRLHLGRPTWITVNANDHAEAEARLSVQVWDRMCERAEVISCFWPSFRTMR